MRSIFSIILLLVASYTPIAKALSFGDVRVSSAMNQPLTAEIDLVDVGDFDPAQIRVNLADSEQFNLTKLTKSPILDNLRFGVVESPIGGMKVLVRSTLPLNEPFISFLMEINWPRGRLIREYTLLLDPPIPEEPAVEIEKPSPPPQPVKLNNTVLNTEDERSILVQSQDTLFEIARNNLPSAEFSIEQMMLALLVQNPESFAAKNINTLKAGSRLTLPTESQLNQLTVIQARQEAKRQYDQWRLDQTPPLMEEIKPNRVEKEVSEVLEPPAKPDLPAPSAEAVKLTLVSAGEAIDSENLKSTDEINARKAPVSSEQKTLLDNQVEALLSSNRQLEDHWLVTQESLTKIERDNVDLSNKLTLIVQQLDRVQRLIELKDQQLALLQAQLSAKNETVQAEIGLAEIIAYIKRNLELVAALLVLFILILWLLIRLSRREKTEVVRVDQKQEPTTSALMVETAQTKTEPEPQKSEQIKAEMDTLIEQAVSEASSEVRDSQEDSGDDTQPVDAESTATFNEVADQNFEEEQTLIPSGDSLSDQQEASLDSDENESASLETAASASKAGAEIPDEWEFVVEERDGDALDTEINQILKEVDAEVELVEEVNDAEEPTIQDGSSYDPLNEIETQLDLARAYIEMNDINTAREMLEMIKTMGSAQQQIEAETLLKQIT